MDTDKTVENLRAMAAEGAGLLAMIEALRSDETFTLTPLHLLRVLNEAFGIPLRESRTLLEFFDPDLRPLVPDAEADRRAAAVLAPYVSRGR
ncbi:MULTISPECIES: hypothetical protein [Streptomyces]|uniref:hypothetical protein n=1 Tax=Streptomyces TaxID=1883 RepID=UPI001F0D5B0D|nr:hypothetical protein [Streptomyces sp. Z423-1]